MRIGKVELKNRVIIGSSPLTSKLGPVQEAERAGAAGVSTKLTFIKQPFYGRLTMYTDPAVGGIICHDRRLDLEEGIALVRGIKEATSLVIMTNITHAGDDLEGWAYLAQQMEAVGADMIEVNLTCPNITLTGTLAGKDPGVKMGGSISEDLEVTRRVVSTLKAAVSIPVVPKFSGRTDVAKVARACQEAGADAITVSAGGHSALPSLDIYNPRRSGYGLVKGNSFGGLVGPARRLSGYADVARAAGAVDIPVIGVGGISTWQHAVEYMMWGASAVQVCTAVMWRGFDVVTRIVHGMEQFAADAGYGSYDEFVGVALGTIRPAYELEIVPGSAYVDPERCNGCGLCLKPGHCIAVSMVDGVAKVDEEACLSCGICVALCKRGAIKLVALEQEAGAVRRISRKGV